MHVSVNWLQYRVPQHATETSTSDNILSVRGPGLCSVVVVVVVLCYRLVIHWRKTTIHRLRAFRINQRHTFSNHPISFVGPNAEIGNKDLKKLELFRSFVFNGSRSQSTHLVFLVLVDLFNFFFLWGDIIGWTSMNGSLGVIKIESINIIFLMTTTTTVQSYNWIGRACICNLLSHDFFHRFIISRGRSHLGEKVGTSRTSRGCCHFLWWNTREEVRVSSVLINCNQYRVLVEMYASTDNNAKGLQKNNSPSKEATL